EVGTTALVCHPSPERLGICRRANASANVMKAEFATAFADGAKRAPVSRPPSSPASAGPPAPSVDHERFDELPCESADLDDGEMRARSAAGETRERERERFV
ncbi:unnamed protein product, partial [Prorocentrum cordatum]